jgi:hypothetical protein
MLVVVLLGDLFSFGGAVDMPDLPGFAAAAPAPMEEESQAFSADMADEQSNDDATMDGADTTALATETAGEMPEERSLAATDEPFTTPDPWLLAELALAFTALLTGLGAWRARQRRPSSES